jgi:hypothetical protein
VLINKKRGTIPMKKCKPLLLTAILVVALGLLSGCRPIPIEPKSDPAPAFLDISCPSLPVAADPTGKNPKVIDKYSNGKSNFCLIVSSFTNDGFVLRYCGTGRDSDDWLSRNVQIQLVFHR